MQKRLTNRIQSAQFQRTHLLKGYQLRFHKRSPDGSAKADAYFTSSPNHELWCALYRIHAQDKPELDAIEGVGDGYEIRKTAIDEGIAFFYVAQSSHIEPSLKPYCWYHAYVLEGARQRQLPHHYIQSITDVEVWEDQHVERHARNWNLLGTTCQR
ncbi:MAG: gamma-glutamylcyclotransferase [Acidobacteria bacterium]|nr:gamma-glutamylcyclotransferase [Acidobacteriota bacterium]